MIKRAKQIKVYYKYLLSFFFKSVGGCERVKPERKQNNKTRVNEVSG